MAAAQRAPTVGLAMTLSFFVLMVLSGDARELRGAGESSVCATIYDPVCDPATGKTYSNDCEAKRNNVDNAVPGACAAPPTDDCVCTLEYAPVCDPATGKTYGNACAAKCAGISSTVPGECPAPPTDDCICTREYAPVCDPATGTTYSNACMARCAGVTATEPGACSTTAKSESEGPTICTLQYDPGCDTLTNTTYGNACQAANAGATWVVPGECSASAARRAAACPKVPNGGSSRYVYDPICVIAKYANQPAVTTSYFNPCIAQAYATKVQGSYKGMCVAAADTACASKVRSTRDQVCSLGTATEYPALCYLQKLEGSRATFYNGQCRQPEAVQLAAKCPPSTRQYPIYQTNCFADPCRTATCSDRTAKCVSRYCAGYFRSTYLSGQCQAVFISWNGTINNACTFGTSG